MSLPAEYLKILADRGKSLKEVGVHETAIPRDATPDLIRALRGTDIAVLGGDVWLETSPGQFSPSYDNWHCDRKPNEPLLSFLVRSWNSAEEYVSAYPESGRGKHLYTVTVTPAS